jgi:hypothetical protein
MNTALSRIDGDLDTMTLGKVLAQSGYFQDAREAAQAIVKVLAGRELGIGPVAAMTGIYIVKGRVTLSANLIGAAIKRSGRYNYRVCAMDNEACAIEFFENGETIGLSEFSMRDAAAAGLSGGNWKSYPRNMLFARAISNGAKWFCPDVFAGPIYTPDELGERVDGETGEPIDITPPPQMTVVELPQSPPPVTTINQALGKKAEVGVDQAADIYWEKFAPVLGARDWSLVQRLLDTEQSEPTTLLGWRKVWTATSEALAAEAEQAA